MNTNTEFERFTQRVYQKLVNNDVLKSTTVLHNIKLIGKSGCEHQIDVYWEYEIAGSMHKVAIECKNYGSLVPIGKVRDFKGVLDDLINVHGIMVSKKGYQKGAKQFAEAHGISLKELRRPGFNESIGSITTTIQANLRHREYMIDDSVAGQDVIIQRTRSFYASFNSSRSDYWRQATHLPIDTIDNKIRDSKGRILTSIEDLERQLPEDPESDTAIFFPFEDGWVASRYWGPVKILEVQFSYESQVQETTLNIAADDFVEAILEDALEEKADYIPKY